jgi:tripartite-type tricarboxylate transporter receptor subunit TctC
MNMSRRAALSLPLATLPAMAGAQTAAYPDRAVRYIVPFTPAGLTDIMARLVALRIGEIWNKPVVVENRAGGNAMIGADAAAKSPPDGHTLLAITLAHAVNVSLFPNAPYDLLRDFAPISVLGSLPLVVCVNPSNPARNLQELMAQARGRVMNGGSSGNGTPPHLGLELFRRASGAGANITHVPYRGGALSVTDLMGNNLQLLVSNLPECLPQLQAGQLRGLAVTGAERHRLIPDIPTVAEAGAPEMQITSWTAMVTNAAVPAPVLAEIARATRIALRDGEARRRAEEGGFDVLSWDADRSRTFIGEEVSRWGRLVREAGIRADV